MVNIQFTKTSVGDVTDTFVVSFPTFLSLRLGTASPAFAQDIPETSEEETIVIKVTGNIQRVYMSYKIAPLDSDLVTSGLASGIDTASIDGQFNFLENEFRPTGIKDSYELSIGSPFNFTRTCTMEDLNIEWTAEDPVNPVCNMVFVVGEVITNIDENVPQRPPTNVAVADVSGDPQVTWTNVASADQGGSSISGYKVERRSQNGSWETLTTSGSTPYNDTSASDTTGVVYKYRVSAVNTQGTGKASKVVKHTRP